MPEKRITRDRSYFVAKRSELITRSRFSLSVQTQKTLLYLISRIKPDDPAGQQYKINIKDYCRVCGYSTDSGYYYQEIKSDIKALASVGAWIETAPGREELFRWLDTAIVDKNDGTLTVTFHTSVAPYLFDLRERYTQYSLFNILAMRSKYSIRLYELLCAVKWQQNVIYDLSDLKIRLDAQNYEKYSHFSARVLEPAIAEINAYTDLLIGYTPIKSGKAYTGIDFTIARKEVENLTASIQLADSLLDRHTQQTKQKK